MNHIVFIEPAGPKSAVFVEQFGIVVAAHRGGNAGGVGKGGLSVPYRPAFIAVIEDLLGDVELMIAGAGGE